MWPQRRRRGVSTLVVVELVGVMNGSRQMGQVCWSGGRWAGGMRGRWVRWWVMDGGRMRGAGVVAMVCGAFGFFFGGGVVCLRWDDGQWMVVEETRLGLER